MRAKCYGSTAVSKTAREGSTPSARANLQRESDGSGTGLQNRVTRFDPAALLHGGRGELVNTAGCEPVTASSILVGHPMLL